MNLQSDTKINDFKKGLYIVSTPIGNLQDITLRAIKILKNSDFILCEDTRVSKKLLSNFNIRGNLISNHKFNEKKNVNKIVNILKSNKIVSMISDAGTPTISDPGYRLIRQAHVEKITVTSIPGPSSVINALSASGLPTDHFYFEGFLPRKKGRLTRFKFLASLPATIVVFESPLRLIKTLKDIDKYFGSRIVCVCREMTKMHEEIFRGSIWKTLNHFQNKSSIKGEVVILIAKEGYDD